MTREEAIRIISGEVLGTTEQTHEAVAMAVEALSAQSEAVISKQEYAEFFLGWLEEYRKQSAKLQGRYLPFEVLGWAASDFRKCFPERPIEP